MGVAEPLMGAREFGIIVGESTTSGENTLIVQRMLRLLVGTEDAHLQDVSEKVRIAQHLHIRNSTAPTTKIQKAFCAIQAIKGS